MSTKAKPSGAMLLGAAGTALSISCGVSEFFMAIAMNREPPKAFSTLFGLISGGEKAVGEQPFFEKRDALRYAPHEQVVILAKDGTRLCGHWFPHEEPKRIILAVHGWRSPWYLDYCAVVDFWRANNCSFLIIDQRGQGESEGDYIGLGLQESEDIPSWIDWINARCGMELPVYIGGISMGATTVLLASDYLYTPNVKGILADCGFLSPDAIIAHIANDNLHIPYAFLKFFTRAIYRRKTGRLTTQKSTVTALQHTRLPVQFFHGEEDRFVPLEMTYENYYACASPKRILTVPGAGHGLSYIVQQKAYEEAYLSFWETYDKA